MPCRPSYARIDQNVEKRCLHQLEEDGTAYIGVLSFSLWKTSPTVPPATDKNALPAKPSKKRTMSIVWMF